MINNDSLPPIRSLPLIFGGKVNPDDVVGRDEIVRCLWGELAMTSVIINETRRFGKTTVLRLMEKRVPEHWICIRTTVQNARTTVTLVELTFSALLQHASIKERVKNVIRKVGKVAANSNISVQGVAFSLHAKHREDAALIFRSVLSDVSALLGKEGKRLVIMWDEFPDAVQAIAQKEGEEAAEDIMAFFRALREQDSEDNIRWLLTGSVGFHHVLSRLRGKRSYINDMISTGLNPLTPEWTRHMAEGLLLGIGIEEKDVGALAEMSGGIPFVLELMIKYIRDNHVDVPLTTEDAQQLLTSAAASPDLGTNWAALLERVESYYEGEHADIAEKLLDAIARIPLRESDLIELLKDQSGISPDSGTVHKILGLLCEDHYLDYAQDSGFYEWRYKPLRTIWRARRRGMGK